MHRERCVVAVYSSDPPALDAFHAFDPESYVAISAISDALIHIAPDGSVAPSLAVSWEQVSPVDWELELRRGVRFHNGEDFDARSVVATFRAHREPTPSAAGGGILAPIVDVVALGSHRVRVTTQFPDAMFLRRLFFSPQYPAGVLEREGRESFLTRPIGTGAYRFVRWERGVEIVLERNPDHWAGRATVDELVLPIIRQKEWYEHLVDGRIDVALNIDSHDAVRLRRNRGIHVESAPAAISQWFLLANRGPLADVRVRRALNHAVQQRILVEIAEHGLGQVQRSVATPEQDGYEPGVAPYAYDPELARRLLAEAGYPEGFTLRGIVGETSTAVFAAVREFLSRVGVRLEGEVMPRSEWIGRVVGPRIMGGPLYDGDFALASVDNPILDSLFHQFIFLFSQGLFSLTRDDEYDQRFLQAATTVSESEPGAARRALERFAAERAMVLFTVQHQVHYASRSGMRVPLPKSGHFNTTAFWDLARSDEHAEIEPRGEHASPVGSDRPDLATLLEGTSHLGTFYLRGGTAFSERAFERVWKNIVASETRWHVQLEPMMRELVSQVEAKTNLANVLGSTERVGIGGYASDGRRLFVNEGYRRLVDRDDRPIDDVLARSPRNPSWAEVREAVDREGSWLGAIHLPTSGRDPSAPDHLHLTVTAASDEDGAAVGYTLVFSDFSGAEERIRTQAIRTILDHVPYALFRVDAETRVLDGYSRSCDRFFTKEGEAIRGAPLAELFAMPPREAEHLAATVQQVFDDVLPERVSLAQIPSRVEVGHRTFALDFAAVRDDDGSVTSMLVSASDITGLVAAQRAEARARGALAVLRHKETFAEFAAGFDAALVELLASGTSSSPAWQISARQHLHTAKGVLAQFSLGEIARRIHDIESEEQLTPGLLETVRAELAALLEENVAIWGIRLGARDPEHTIARSALDELRRASRQAKSVEELRAFVDQFVARSEARSVRELLGPIEDACRQHAARRGKQVRFELEGGDIAVPRHLEEVFPVITHLLRNAVDHGIELPDERAEKGPCGRVAVRVRGGDALTIVVEDDGRGIDVERVVARAVEMGRMTREAAERASAEERLALINTAQLSTADEVSDTTGRGIGMSAVDEVVRSLSGTMRIETEPGRGARFEIRMPLAPRRSWAPPAARSAVS